jgi:hypothetical protein
MICSSESTAILFVPPDECSVRAITQQIETYPLCVMRRALPIASLMIQQTQDPFRDDIVLDFVRSTVDGDGLAGEPGSRALDFKVGITFAGPAQSLISNDFD